MEVQDAEDAIAQGVYVTSSEVREKLGIRLIGESDLSSSFGSVKSFPDGLSFQMEARNEWECN